MEGNDNDASASHAMWSGRDPQGQGAILPAESLLHGLIARSVITVNDAVEIVDVAAAVKAGVSPKQGDNPHA